MKNLRQAVSELSNNKKYIVISCLWDSYWVDELTKKEIENMIKKGERFPTQIIEGKFIYNSD